jgi:hypothetical protein
VTGPRVLLWATLILIVVAVAFAVTFASTGDARYLAAMVAAGAFAVCTADPVKQHRRQEVPS